MMKGWLSKPCLGRVCCLIRLPGICSKIPSNFYLLFCFVSGKTFRSYLTWLQSFFQILMHRGLFTSSVHFYHSRYKLSYSTTFKRLKRITIPVISRSSINVALITPNGRTIKESLHKAYDQSRIPYTKLLTNYDSHNYMTTSYQYPKHKRPIKGNRNRHVTFVLEMMVSPTFHKNKFALKKKMFRILRKLLNYK